MQCQVAQINAESEDLFFTSSFAADLDPEYITAVNQIENEYFNHAASKDTNSEQTSTKTPSSKDTEATGPSHGEQTAQRGKGVNNNPAASTGSSMHSQGVGSKRTRNMATPSARQSKTTRLRRPSNPPTPSQSPLHKRRKDENVNSSDELILSSPELVHNDKLASKSGGQLNEQPVTTSSRRPVKNAISSSSSAKHPNAGKTRQLDHLDVDSRKAETEKLTSNPHQNCSSEKTGSSHSKMEDDSDNKDVPQLPKNPTGMEHLLLDSQSPDSQTSGKESVRLCPDSSSPTPRQRNRVRPSRRASLQTPRQKNAPLTKPASTRSRKHSRERRESPSLERKSGKRGKFASGVSDRGRSVDDKLDCSYASVYLESQRAQNLSSSSDGESEDQEKEGSENARAEGKDSESVRAEYKDSESARAEDKDSQSARAEGKDSESVRAEDKDSESVRAEDKDASKDPSEPPVAVAADETSTLSGYSNQPLKPIGVNQTEGDEGELLLSSWGLPEAVLSQYRRLGITRMFPWQVQCLRSPGVLEGGNLVYSAPTSAGKTLVAELLVLKRVLETRRKALFILPFVSVAREKTFALQALYQDVGVRVGGFMGGHSPPGGLSALDVAVCTIEKGNGLLNRMLEEGTLDKLGVVVVDELHMVGDPHRGYLLELFLTKICYMARRARDVGPRPVKDGTADSPVQVIGMSATLPNLDLLARWLDAALFRTHFRPVPLTECLKVGTAVYDARMNRLRDLDPALMVKGDEDHMVPLCLETVLSGCSVLIFSPTKARCEKLAENIAREFYNICNSPKLQTSDRGFVKASEIVRLPLDWAQLRDVVEQLRRTPVGLDACLGRSVRFGVAYHHAGLTFDERDIVEGAFRQGAVKVLVATSTLSSGVNLPARRVLIRTPIFHGRLLDTLVYKQMSGRAGRKGVDTKGESILVCKPNEQARGQSLLTSDLPPVHSCLVRHDSDALSGSLKRAVLEVIVSGVVTAPEDVASYLSCTLLSASMECQDDRKSDLIRACLHFLQSNEFVCLRPGQGEGAEARFCPSQLGEAVLASSLSPDEGLIVFADMQRARRCFVLENELHIIYLVTPIYAQDISANLDWFGFYGLWERLPPDMQRVAELVGVSEAFINRAIRGRLPTHTAEGLRTLAVHRRFYTALVLMELVAERPLVEVARKFNCNKGQLQALQQSAATFAGMVTVFCARLGWTNLELLLSQFQSRLTFGVQRELCDLVRLCTVNGQRARALFNAGFHTAAALATADVTDVEHVLRTASPFQSCKPGEGETEAEAAGRQRSRCVWLPGRQAVTEQEAALAIVQEAKQLIQQELGGLRIHWGSKVNGQGQGGHDTTTDSESIDSRVSDESGNVSAAGMVTSPLQDAGEKENRSGLGGNGSDLRTPAQRRVMARNRSRSCRRSSLLGKKTPSPLTHDSYKRRRNGSLEGVNRSMTSSYKKSPLMSREKSFRDLSSVSILIPPEATPSKKQPQAACLQTAAEAQSPESCSPQPPHGSDQTPWHQPVQSDERLKVPHQAPESSVPKNANRNTEYHLGLQSVPDERLKVPHQAPESSVPKNLHRSAEHQLGLQSVSGSGNVSISSAMSESSHHDGSTSHEASAIRGANGSSAAESDLENVKMTRSRGKRTGQHRGTNENPSRVTFDFTEDTALTMEIPTENSDRSVRTETTVSACETNASDSGFVCSKQTTALGASFDRKIPVDTREDKRSPARDLLQSDTEAARKGTNTDRSPTENTSPGNGGVATSTDSAVHSPTGPEVTNTESDIALAKMCDEDFFADSFVLNTQIVKLMGGGPSDNPHSQVKVNSNDSVPCRQSNVRDHSHEHQHTGERKLDEEPKKAANVTKSPDVFDSEGFDINIENAKLSRCTERFDVHDTENPTQGDSSQELIASGNYDCPREFEEGFFDQSGQFDLDTSYDQLDIKGQEQAPPDLTSDRTSEREAGNRENNAYASPPKHISAEKSQNHEVSPSAFIDEKELQEDLDIAMNMSDSFYSHSLSSASGVVSPNAGSSDSSARGPPCKGNAADTEVQALSSEPQVVVPGTSAPSSSRANPSLVSSRSRSSDIKPDQPDTTPNFTSKNKGPRSVPADPAVFDGRTTATAAADPGVSEAGRSPQPQETSPIGPVAVTQRMSSTPNCEAPHQSSSCQSVFSDSLSASVVDKIFLEAEIAGVFEGLGRKEASKICEKGEPRFSPPKAGERDRENVPGVSSHGGEYKSRKEQGVMLGRGEVKNCHQTTKSKVDNWLGNKKPSTPKTTSEKTASKAIGVRSLASASASPGVTTTDRISPNISNGSDCVPPTPPEETSAVSSPCLRLTPSRLCKDRSQRALLGSGKKTSQSLSSRQTRGDSTPAGKKPLREGNDKRKTKSGKTETPSKSSTSRSECGKVIACPTERSAVSSKGKEDSKGREGQRGTGFLQNNPSHYKPSSNTSTARHEDNNKITKPQKISAEGSTDKRSIPTQLQQDDTEQRVDNTCRTSDDREETRRPTTSSQSDGLCESQAALTIIDVCADARLWRTFLQEWRGQTRFSIALACDEPTRLPAPPVTIGGKFLASGTAQREPEGEGAREGEGAVVVTGMAVCWENHDAFYIHLAETQEQEDPDDSLAPPSLDASISLADRVAGVQALLEDRRQVELAAFDAKAQFCALARSCGVVADCLWRDPRVGLWLLDPGAREAGFHRMVKDLLPGETPLLEGVGGGIGLSSLGLTAANPGSGRYRAAVDCVLTLGLMTSLTSRLQDHGLLKSFTDIEMPALISLARMELNGFGFSQAECESQKTLLSAKLTELEEQAYSLAGHPFSLSSTDDIAQVLYVELGLPVNGDPHHTAPLKTLGPNRRATARGRGKPKFSTSKEVLEKLRALHPLPVVVLEWRRLSAALTRQVFPLQKEKVYNARTDMERIFAECQFHTATGRVSMSEPNLQNIPKDFEVSHIDVPVDSPAAAVTSRRQGSRSSSRQRGSRPSLPRGGPPVAISMRHAFVPFQGGVLLAADYSQLELRLIAHLSDDARLIHVLNSDGDVFKLIAAQWKRVSPEQVTSEQRQQAKQVCYGMLYGIGAKALGEQLGVDENDAGAFIETFKARYPGMRSYLRDTVESCRREGYVRTITGRRRYLPAIKDGNPYARAQAERQAVNTTVQGSAADLVKTAMAAIDRQVAARFPDSRLPHRFLLHPSARDGARARQMPRGAYLVLQLHDELIFEVHCCDVAWVASAVKETMETAMTLKVKMPVKVRVGPSWGRLEDYDP